MPHSRLYYHAIWGTKYREPTITPQIESHIFDFIRSKAIGLGGYVYALGGTEDHIHLVVHIPRTMPVSQYIGKIKGSSSARLNKLDICTDKFYWQSEYAIFTISEFMLPRLIHYAENQKAHHNNKSTRFSLEL